MRITFYLPPDLERSLRGVCPDLDAEAKEAFLVQLFMQGRLMHGQFANALGVSRDEADGILKKRGVYLDVRPEQVEQDVCRLLESLGQ